MGFDETISLPPVKREGHENHSPGKRKRSTSGQENQANSLTVKQLDSWISNDTAKWRRRKDVRPGEIAAAALDVFVAKGYSAAHMSDIAAQAGVSKGTVYLFFDSKEALFKSVIEENVVPALEVGERLAASFTGNSSDLLKLLLNGLWQQINTARLSAIINLVISESRSFPEIAQHYYQVCVVRGRALLHSVIERGIAANEFQDLDIESCINIAVAPIVMQVVWRHSFFFCEPELDFETYLSTYQKLLIEGLEKLPVDLSHRSKS